MIDLGISNSEFRDGYRDRKFLFKRSSIDTSDFSWDTINDLLDLAQQNPSSLKMINDGTVDKSAYSTEVIDFEKLRWHINKSAFYHLMQNGATAVFSRLENISPSTRRIAREVAQIIGAKTAVNAYLSFKGDGTFGKHWDTHDVFVIQLFGTKHWSVYEPTFELPLRDQKSKFRKLECPDLPVLDTVLKPGDVIYLPRGWWHCATPIGEPSFHLTVGAHQPKMIDFAAWCVTKYLPDFLVARKSAYFDIDAGNDVKELSEALAQFIGNPQYYDQYARECLQSEITSTPFSLESFMSGHNETMPDGRSIQLSVATRTNADQRYMRINGSLGPRSPAELEVISLLSSREKLTPVEIAALLPGTPADVTKAACLNLLKNDIVSLV